MHNVDLQREAFSPSEFIERAIGLLHTVSLQDRSVSDDEGFLKEVLFLSISDGKKRAVTIHRTGESYAAALAACNEHLARSLETLRIKPVHLRLDRVVKIRSTTWLHLQHQLTQIKRNYFRLGIAFDNEFKLALTEQEINANAVFYCGSDTPHVRFNENNFRVYLKRRFPEEAATPSPADDLRVSLFTTEAWYLNLSELKQSDLSSQPHYLPPPDLDDWRSDKSLASGRRRFDITDAKSLTAVLSRAANYLAAQVGPDGKFIYGYFPCFGREIATYNTLRHASSLYALVEAFEVFKDPVHHDAIIRGIQYLVDQVIRHYPQPDGSVLAYVVEINGEIKLGANAVAILALVKYAQVSGDSSRDELLSSLALGILRMQDPSTGHFVHVLNAADLSVKDPFRVVYYEGEASFALMRLYAYSGDPQWIACVKLAFKGFIERDYHKYHDHWLSYASAELLTHQDSEELYDFAINNIKDYLTFIKTRETTFPTLLELGMAFYRVLLIAAKRGKLKPLFERFDYYSFLTALLERADKLMNGVFWPEFAMFYPQSHKIVGSFFIRHHGFRVRIDDVEHYLSGLLAFRRLLLGEYAHLPGFRSILACRNQLLIQSSNPSIAGESGAERVVGYLGYPSGPLQFVALNAIAEKAFTQGIQLFFIPYRKNFVGTEVVLGYLFTGELPKRWTKMYRRLPAIIDNSPARTRAESGLFADFDQRSFLLCHEFAGKDVISRMLSEHESLRPYLLESVAITPSAIDACLDQYSSVVVKPPNSSQGRNVFIVDRSGSDGYRVRSDAEEKVLANKVFRDEFLPSRIAERWLVQEYFPSLNLDGGAFDVRVPVFRRTENEWSLAGMYARTGHNKVTSNLATGGKAVAAEPFLSSRFGSEEAQRIMGVLEEVALKIADVLQAGHAWQIDALGCDFGISERGIKLYEVNAYPGIEGCFDSAVDCKVAYYVNLMQSLSGGTLPARNSFPSHEVV